jgi:hypothetical protein
MGKVTGLGKWLVKQAIFLMAIKFIRRKMQDERRKRIHRKRHT